ncbi:MAG: hypothetical protein EBR49_14175 [Betaproteobacteria bacterium]|nr:hypothetical protein [Betaproteobacteria bacterium]
MNNQGSSNPKDLSSGVASLIDIFFFVLLVVLGVAVMWGVPKITDPGAKASLAGALFGSSAVLLANWINRLNEHHKARSSLTEQRTKLKTLIAAELVNLAVGLIETKELMDAAVTAMSSGGTGPGSVDMAKCFPRNTPMTDSLGASLLILDGPAIDALAMLRVNLAETRKTMESNARIVGSHFGLSLSAATVLSRAVGHDMTVLADVVDHIAPNRRFKLNDTGEPQLLNELLRQKAKDPSQLD